MDKNKIKETLKTKLKQEMSTTGTGASVTPGIGAGVATKYAFGKINKSKPTGWKDAPSIPNRPSKAFDYKELWETINAGDATTDEILTYLQAAKQQGKLSPDAQQVLIQWINSPGASREEIIKVLRQLTGVYLKEENLNEGIYIPDNIIRFAKRKNVLDVVKQVARWVEKADKRIMGGTAIGKNYDTLILDLTHQGSEIYINCSDESIEVKGEPVDNYNDFVSALGVEESLQMNEGDVNYKVGDIIHFKDGEDWKIMKVKDNVNKLVIKPHNEKAKENNTSLEIDIDLDYVKKNINEGYAQFRNSTKTRTKPEQFHQAVKEVKKKVNEINRLFEYMDRLKSELNEGEEIKYKKYTENAIQKIKESTKSLFLKSTKLK